MPPEKIIGTKVNFDSIFDSIRKCTVTISNSQRPTAASNRPTAPSAAKLTTSGVCCFKVLFFLNRDLTVSANRRWLKREIFSPETNDEVPKCEKCQGVVRPDVVLFGRLIYLFQG